MQPMLQSSSLRLKLSTSIALGRPIVWIATNQLSDSLARSGVSVDFCIATEIVAPMMSAA